MNWRFWLSDKTVRKFEELPIYCQQQNCSPGILVSSEVWLCEYSRGFAGKLASNDSGVVQNGDFRFFRSPYRPNLHIQGHNYYTVLCIPLVALHWRRKGWHWMTLNGHFALTSGPSSASNGWRSGFRRKLIGNLQSYAYNCQRNKNVAQRLYWW